MTIPDSGSILLVRQSSEGRMFSQGLFSGVETLFLESFPVIFLNDLEHMHNCVAAIKQSVNVCNIVTQGELMAIRSSTRKRV